jgi:hypothetical protein
MKPTDYFTAEEVQIIDESIVDAQRMAALEGGVEDRGLGFIPIILGVVAAAAQLAQARMAQTKAMKANAAAMTQQAAEMRAYANEQIAIQKEMLAARQAVATLQVQQDAAAQQQQIAVEQQQVAVAGEATSALKSMAIPAAVAGAATVAYMLLKR